MFEIFKKTFLKGKTAPSPSQDSTKNQEAPKVKLADHIDKLSDFVANKYQDLTKETKTIKHKLNNLPETNYNLGLKHLENGNLADAIFRFKFINRFWPGNQDAHYYLAYCLYLKKQNAEAKRKLEELLKINPNYDSKAKELLEKINNNNPSL